MTKEICCTEDEEEIFNLVRNHAERLKNVTPRVVGGWVRDKVMGSSCFDMDIALENITGYEFASGLKQSAAGQSLTNVHIIRQNPEKSKHLETAVMKINGLCVDFVGLRSESYFHTRIPSVVPGTPQEDALRRDLTINSLFYNLFTGKIEDYTGKGLEDIENMILRTPLDPRETLLNDPLRLVRIFRFYSKFVLFRIDSAIYDALKDVEIRKGLVRKVSRERVYTEVFKMACYPAGQHGFIEIIRRDYVDPIFQPPVKRTTCWERGKMFCDVVEKITNMWEKPYRKDILCLYTILHFFSRSVVPGNEMVFSNVHIMRTSLPSPKRLISTINKIEQNIALLDSTNMKELYFESLVRMVREMGRVWYESFVIYAAMEQVSGNREKYMDALRVIYNISQKSISECYLTKPVVRTEDLAKVLNIPDASLRVFIEESIVYQISNNTDDQDKIVDYLKEQKDEIYKKFGFS